MFYLYLVPKERLHKLISYLEGSICFMDEAHSKLLLQILEIMINFEIFYRDQLTL